MLTEKELQEIRIEVETSIKTGSGMVLATIASKLLDHIDSLPKPPQVLSILADRFREHATIVDDRIGT